MNSAPITSWEGAEAYFTFADKPALLVALTLVGVGVCIWTIASMAIHENKAYKDM
ncbi:MULTISPECIES: hypothetical protein [Thalassospira]|jgi:hypothetical protein|uniref:hypothetical protein n=1 Tax=Thalassospira TaxID=168934 RepID=UPI0009D0EF06|nr:MULTISPECIES: hypothetical protein [Thalassospira]BDW89846.1 hypothetical protein MACH01_26130 [Thalassospira tepidiphila]MBO6580816.1 hypothetical protein [Thalassospira sp.]MBO6804072.1 hypothetical protein [Thalassospira sp.]MBO6820039.1 hypothetical protein [Thalassospira sp.]MBO6887808.1 hypothetical protein [Thalassospira sp.]|tara:strand:- start:363 stop:527 length:165 start_codon:yes stop_codon:yes gene_type:complete